MPPWFGRCIEVCVILISSLQWKSNGEGATDKVQPISTIKFFFIIFSDCPGVACSDA